MIASLLLLCLPAFQEDWAGDPSCLGKDAEPFQRVASLSEDVSLLNLINGLCLTRDQMERLTELSRRAARARREELERRRKAAEELGEALRELRGRLLDRDTVVPT